MKIDKSFIQNEDGATDARELTRKIIEMGKALDLLVIELRGVGRVLKRLGNCLPRSPAPLEFQNDTVPPPVQRKQVNDATESRLHLPSDDQ